MEGLLLHEIDLHLVEISKGGVVAGDRVDEGSVHSEHEELAHEAGLPLRFAQQRIVRQAAEVVEVTDVEIEPPVNHTHTHTRTHTRTHTHTHTQRIASHQTERIEKGREG